MSKIIWLTGQSGAGKTSLAKELQRHWPCIILDGDEMRSSISLNTGFSREDRTAHNLRVARLASVLVQQINVVVSVIAPIGCVRDRISDMCNPIWVHVKRTLPEREGHFYEVPWYYPILDHDVLSIKESVEQLKKIVGLKTKKQYSFFIGRWQPLHEGHLALFDKVRQEGKKILIGIRDTEISETDPYSVSERIEMIRHRVPDAEIVTIPDIEEVVHGRKVGWGIRQIQLDEMIENISATKIREKNCKE